MNPFCAKRYHPHEENLQQTHLDQLSGSKQLFRDRYEILLMLGRGGFGITFLAQDAILPGNYVSGN